MYRVLIVEDDADINATLQEAMRIAGYDAVGSLTGEEAFAEVQRRCPDLVLLDQMLPDIDGVEICRRLRAAPRTKRVPIIFLTARAPARRRVKRSRGGRRRLRRQAVQHAGAPAARARPPAAVVVAAGDPARARLAALPRAVPRLGQLREDSPRATASGRSAWSFAAASCTAASRRSAPPSAACSTRGSRAARRSSATRKPSGRGKSSPTNSHASPGAGAPESPRGRAPARRRPRGASCDRAATA